MNPSPSQVPKRSSGATLERALGLHMATAVVVGNVIGSGIFLKPGTIAAESGNFAVIISVWLFGGLLCILGAICFAELAAMLPQAGGIYVYLREAYGRLVAFLFGWCEFLFARPSSIGALAVAFVGSLSLTLPSRYRLSPLGEVLLATVLIGGMAWVNILGVLWGGRLQMVTTLIKAVFLALVALSPLLCIPLAGWTLEEANYATTVEPRQAGLAAQVAAVLLAVMWAYNGWDGVTPLAEEVRDPGRNIPLALFVGVGALIVLYVGANIAYHGVLSMSELKSAGDHAAESMLYKLAGPAGQRAMSLVIMCSTFGAINSNLLQAPRIIFAMGRDQVFFRGLGHVHAVYRTPSVAIFVKSLMAVLLIAAVAVAKYAVGGADLRTVEWTLLRRILQSLQDDSIFEVLTNFVIFSLSIFYLLAVLAVIVLRTRFPSWQRPYKTWGYPVVPLVFSAVYVWFLWQIYVTSPLESRVGLAFVALGVPVYFAYRRWGSGR
jgi:APA family basic amino acid/polyamine antiporter